MRLISNILAKLGYIKKRSGTSSPAQWLIDWVTGGEETSSGKKVNENSALKYTPFWAAVRIISGTIASLPFMVYQHLENGGKKKLANHRVYKLLHDRPNEYMDALTFIETRQAHVLTYGNGYAEIQRDGAGRPIALWPLLPDRTERKLDKNNVPYYEVRTPTRDTVNLPDYNVLHIKGLGFDGYTGYDVVTYHKEAIAYGIAVKEYAGRFYGNDASPGGVLEHPTQLSDAAYKRLQESWNANQKGLTQAHRMQILEEGMKWSQTGVDPQKAQALEVQKYTVDDCARIFNIPPHKLASLERATFSNIEEQNIDFITMTMLYWFRKWELECNYKLFMPSEFGRLFCEILVAGLLRGNIKDRYAAYAIGKQWGFLNTNDIHEWENMNPIGPSGDIYLAPMNMMNMDSLLEPDLYIQPADDNNPNRSKIEAAHKKILIVQWSRIINKQINAIANGISDDFYQKHRDWAITILREPVQAYASLKSIIPEKAGGILCNIVEDNINNRKKLKVEDCEKLAEKLMQEIGGYNA